MVARRRNLLLPSQLVRSPGGRRCPRFGAHESGGVWSVYAGVRPTGILQGVWSPTRRTLVFSPKPELTVAPPGSLGAVTQKVTGFADCGGANVLNHQHDALSAQRRCSAFRRSLAGSRCTAPHRLGRTTADCGALRACPITGRHRSFSRRRATATCTGSTISHGANSTAQRVPAPGSVADGLIQTLEFRPVPAVRQMLASQGVKIPTTGRGSIDYVIAAYNNGDFQTMKIAGVERQIFGFEWGYQGVCPTTQKCGPIASGAWCTSTPVPASRFGRIRDNRRATNCAASADRRWRHRPRSPSRSVQARPSCPSGRSCPRRSRMGGSTTAGMTAILPRRRHGVGSQRRHCGPSARPSRRKEDPDESKCGFPALRCGRHGSRAPSRSLRSLSACSSSRSRPAASPNGSPVGRRATTTWRRASTRSSTSSSSSRRTARSTATSAPTRAPTGSP